jgi:hypothetical protein
MVAWRVEKQMGCSNGLARVAPSRCWGALEERREREARAWPMSQLIRAQDLLQLTTARCIELLLQARL